MRTLNLNMINNLTLNNTLCIRLSVGFDLFKYIV